MIPSGIIRRSHIFLFLLGLPAFGGPSIQGVDNFFKLNDHVYRGAQPTGEGFRNLAKLGIKTVVDLREADARAVAEERTVTAAGMQYINVPMTGLTPPTNEQMAKIMTFLQDGSGGPVFVHCKRGADRTGAVMAAYRIEHDQWDNNRALSEAKALGMGSFQFPRQNYVRGYQAHKIQARPLEAKAGDTQGLADGPGSQSPINIQAEPALAR
jgi:protein tyrosine phosphatase (PTP) superfamily phosphohydrolase (DUF442 family)